MSLFQLPNKFLNRFIPLAFLFILVISLFADIIFSEKNLVLSHPQGDLTSEFLHSRQFGFNELKNGNLPLWNPYIFSGVPFFESMQPALMYPLNWIYLIFPLRQAINIEIVLHVFLSGIFMYLWVVYRGYSKIAGILSGTLFMFCGAHFMHIMAGHLSNLSTMIWAPLLFLSADGWLKTRNVLWCFLGMGTVTMQIFAGHPQYLFYNGIAFSVYSLLKVFKAKDKGRALFGLATFYFGGILLGAIQFYPAIADANETLRGGVISYKFAAIFSFPPENFITLLVPKFFGDMISNHYWGRHLLWEMSLYLSISGLVLAFIGTFPLKHNEQCIPLVTILILLLL